MTTDQSAVPTNYWHASSTNGPEDQILPSLRKRLVALVAALVVQATIALLGVLPGLPGAHGAADAPYWYAYGSQPVSFWIQFAVIELMAAVIVSLGFGPGVRVGDIPVIGRLVLGIAFVALPAAAIVLGGVDAAQTAGGLSPAAAAASWLTTAFFGTLFFGLPLVALAARPGERSRV
jgi:hypothetical protein